MRDFLIASSLLSAILGATLTERAVATDYDQVIVRTFQGQSDIERRVAGLLADRLRERGCPNVIVDSTARNDRSLLISLGVVARHAELRRLCRDAGVVPPTEQDPGPEGFLLADVPGASFRHIVVAAVDDRGALYAVGALLRTIVVRGGHVRLPDSFAIRTAPAFEMRGTHVSQGHTMRELTGSRAWTRQEWRHELIDYALAGANTFEMSSAHGEEIAFVRSYGLKTLYSQVANAGSGPDAWAAVEAIGRKGYLCPSIPAAREALLQQCANRWKGTPAYDYVRFKSGDGGGCECDRCAPYGGVYIELCEDLAAVIREYHPHTTFFALNQKLDNAGDHAIFAYLNAAPREWLRGIAYGPGSNAMGWMPGRRQDHRTDLFRYPAFGSYDRYLREMLEQMPARHAILFFTDLTHWVYSQYGLMDHQLIPDHNAALPPASDRRMYAARPDPYLAMVYNRRTFHARPQNYHYVFRQTLRYGIGDVTYTEGHHDHFNQWMWQRLLWNPHRSVREAVAEYARAWFGPEAAPTMTEAILQSETNLSADLMANDGIDRQITLLQQAYQTMPAAERVGNVLWRETIQRALLDKVIELKVRRQLQIESDVEGIFRLALDDGEFDIAVAKATQRLAEDTDTPQMTRLLEATDRWGRESDRLFGVRNEGFYNLKQDFVGLGWLRRQVKAVGATSDEAERRRIAREVAVYEDAGEGGFYDDAGDPDRSPHLTRGWPYGDGHFSMTNRPSQRTAAFTTVESPGVTFEYRRLDPNASYRVRLALIRPIFKPRFAMHQRQQSESIFADGHCLAKDLTLPEFESQFFEYSIPREATADGALKLWFEKSPGVGEGPAPEVTVWRNTGGWGTLVSEVWLMKESSVESPSQ